MPASYKISLYPQNVAAIFFAGSIDGPVVQKALEECIKRGYFQVVIDLSGVGSAPSNAIGVFQGLRSSFEQKAGRLVFLEPDGTVRIVLEMMGFREVFRFYPDLDTALQDMIDTSGQTRRVSL